MTTRTTQELVTRYAELTGRSLIDDLPQVEWTESYGRIGVSSKHRSNYTTVLATVEAIEAKQGVTLATARQIAYIESLGGVATPGLTKQQASQVIDNLKASPRRRYSPNFESAADSTYRARRAGHAINGNGEIYD